MHYANSWKESNADNHIIALKLQIYFCTIQLAVSIAFLLSVAFMEK